MNAFLNKTCWNRSEMTCHRHLVVFSKLVQRKNEIYEYSEN